MLQKTTKLFLTTLVAIATINTIETPQIPNTTNSWLTIQTEAQAKSSGGRSGGGSFSRGSSGSRGRSRSSSPSRSRSRSYNNSPSYNNNNSRDYSGSRTYYSSGSSYNNGGQWANPLILFIFFGVVGIIIYIVVSNSLKSVLGVHSQTNNFCAYNRERDNDIVTISQLQIALLASATDIQSGLTKLSLRVNTTTEQGLRDLLQESILILLRNSEYWTHHIHSSEKFHIDQGESKFNSLSLAQRSKLSSETLSNVEGNIRQQSVVCSDDESAMYIVVSLLIGTAHDQPLFHDIRTPDDLETALNQIGAMPSDYLFKFELIWTPQTENDSLTYDEFITEYTNMVQLA